MTIPRIQIARDTLEMITPMKKDCGRQCSAACCKPDADGQGGMILFPGEESFYSQCDFATIAESDIRMNGKPLCMLTCDGHCDRSKRPLACRIFPLTPYVQKGKLSIVLDIRAWPICPLMPFGLDGLSGEFLHAVRDMMNLLWKDDACRAYMLALSKQLDAYQALT